MKQDVCSPGGVRESRSGSRAQIAAMLPVCTMYDHGSLHCIARLGEPKCLAKYLQLISLQYTIMLSRSVGRAGVITQRVPNSHNLGAE